VTDSRPLAVVTGASNGIGRELTRQFATNDFDVVGAAEDDELAAAANDLRGGADVQAVRADRSTQAKPSHHDYGVAQCRKALGRAAGPRIGAPRPLLEIAKAETKHSALSAIEPPSTARKSPT
jgi:NAD(P)-dependent dehydrogenase (short-subunit alcohol dehydrogenase family)